MTREELLERLRTEGDPDRRQAIVTEAMESLSPEDLQAFVRDAGTELTPQQRDRIRTFSESSPGLVAQQAADDADQSDFVAADDIDSLFDAATDPASPGGEEVTPEEDEAIRSAGGEGVGDGTPSWILDLAGGQYLTDDQKVRVINDINFNYGSSFRTWEQLIRSPLMGREADVTADLAATVKDAIFDVTAAREFGVDLLGGRKVSIRAEQWESALSLWGLDERELTKVVKAADRVGMHDSVGNPAWQPMAALLKTFGMLDSFVAANRDTIPTGIPEGDVVPSSQARHRGRTDRRGNPVTDTSGVEPDMVGEPILDDKPLAYDEAGMPVQRFVTGITSPRYDEAGVMRGGNPVIRTPAELAYTQREGMRLYNNDVLMAHVHTVDSNLAAKIKRSVRDPSALTTADLNRLKDLISLTGAPTMADFVEQLTLQGEARLQGDVMGFFGSYLNGLVENSGGLNGDDDGGPPAIRDKPDPASLDERLRDLYQTMFFEEPDEATLANFRSQINAAIDGAAPGDTVDWGARASQFARQDPKYADLYGAKPDTVSEDDYRYQFEAGQADMLGADRAGNAAAMAGMRDGTYQTTVGAAAGTKEAWDNSTFLGRLARAAQAVGEMT